LNDISLCLSHISLQERNDASERTHEVLQMFFSFDSFVDSESVWVGLADSEHDFLIVSALDRKGLADLSDCSLRPILEMRLNMLTHLSCRLKAGQISDTLNVEFPVFRQRMAQFLRMALFLSHPIQNLREARACASILNLVEQVSLEYFRLLHHVLVSISGVRGDTENVRNDDVVFFSILYQSLIGSSDPMNDAIYEVSAPEISSFKKFGASLFDQLQRCSATVGMLLLESLAVLAIVASRTNPEILYKMIDLNWEAMKMNVHAASATIMVEPPTALEIYVRRFCPSVLQPQVGLSSGGGNFESVLKLIHQGCETPHSILPHILSQHWSLVVLSQGGSELLVDHLNRFLLELRTYLEDNDKPQEITVPITIDGNETPQDSCIGDLVDTTTPVKDLPQRNFTFSDTFPCLNSDSCCQYFDSLLKLTVASVGAFLVIRSNHSHPFTKLEDYFELCGSLLEMLKNDDGAIFAEAISPSVIQTLKLLLDISIEKIELCLDWRNPESQLSPEELAAAAYDPASKNILQDLMNAFCVEIIGSLEILCSEHKNDSRLASLNRKVERTLDLTRQICVEFDLGDVKTQYSDTSETSAERKTKRREIEAGRLQQYFETSTIEEQGGTLDKEDEHESKDDEASCWSVGDTDDSSGTGAFGVSGNWGQGHRRKNISGDDDSSRELGEISIIH
jgi:hypothetical protein